MYMMPIHLCKSQAPPILLLLKYAVPISLYITSRISRAKKVMHVTVSPCNTKFTMQIDNNYIPNLMLLYMILR